VQVGLGRGAEMGGTRWVASRGWAAEGIRKPPRTTGAHTQGKTEREGARERERERDILMLGHENFPNV